MKTMRKRFGFLSLILVLVMSVTVLTACANKDKDKNNTTPVKLATPVVTIADDGTASWKAIDGATKYAYSLNDATPVEITATSIKLDAGDTIKVRAIGDDKKFTTSDFSASAKYLNELFKMTFAWANDIDNKIVKLTVTFTDIAQNKTHDIIFETTNLGEASEKTTVTRGSAPDTKTEEINIPVVTFTNKKGTKTFHGYNLSDIIANMKNKKGDKQFVGEYVCIKAINADNALKIITASDVEGYKFCYNTELKSTDPADATTRIQKGDNNETQQNRVQSLIFFGK